MPLKVPFTSPKSGAKSKGKTPTPSRGKNTSKAAPKKGRGTPHAQPEPVSVSWWDSLSPERKLDVVGVIMAVIMGMIVIMTVTVMVMIVIAIVVAVFVIMVTT